MPDPTPLHPEFGVRIRTRDPEAVRAAVDDHSFVLVPGGAEGDEAQLALTRALGEPEPNHVALGREGRVEYFGTIGNVQPDGTALGNGHRRTVFQTGNNMWHSDSSFREVPSYVSVMCAYEVPSEGGETQFVSLRAAYGRLDGRTRARVDPLICIHDYVFSRSKVAPDAVTPSHAASLPPVRQRLVRRNPANGLRNLYLGSHTREIEGLEYDEGRALLDGLQEEATGREHVHTHRWQPGDLVIWDNRCLLHRGTGYDADRHRRLMRQTRVRGVANTLLE